MTIPISEDLQTAFEQCGIVDGDLELFPRPVRNAMMEYITREKDPEARRKRIDDVIRLVTMQKNRPLSSA